MFSKLKSCGLLGIDGFLTEVETDICNGIPAFDIVGLGDATIRESKERVRSAIKNSNMEFPVRRITMNLAPANLKKEGSSFDLAIALGILAATGQVDGTKMDNFIFVGELALDGEIRPIRGVLPVAICAMEEGIENLMLPAVNVYEAAVVRGLNVFPVKSVRDIINHFNGIQPIEAFKPGAIDYFKDTSEYLEDFSDVKGQENVKRALEVAASGAHNCFLLGSPGSGKTMLARRLPTILPEMTFEEALEVTKIHSIAGILPQGASLVFRRPFRSPHHTISDTGLVGGGKIPKPGELSLAHYGVLFLDELPEFSKKSLEVLRQPLEDGAITISRVNATLTYPTKTTLICAANPCKCGMFLDPSGQCACTPRQIQQYLGKLSGPLLDRMDLQVEVASVKYKDLDNGREGDPSAVIRARVDKTRKIQIERYREIKIYSNSELQPSMLNKFCRLDAKGKELLRNAFERLGLSARAHSRILKVARTIADMEASENIKPVHIAEAIQYRSLDRKIWNM